MSSSFQFQVDLCPFNVYIVVMKIVNVATLKQKLSKYLHFVEDGNEVVVTSHRRRIVRMIPENDRNLVVRDPSLPLSTLRKIRGVKCSGSWSAVENLISDRNRR